MIIKHPLEVPVVVKKLSNYQQINKKLLKYFDEVSAEKVAVGEGYSLDNKTWMEDSFYKLDWKEATDFNRPWVKYFLSFFKNELIEIKNELYYEECHLKEIWFQQYEEHNGHSWHTHGENFTGVYYVELSKQSPKTQIVNPFDGHTVYELDIEEGDIVVFPSFTLHRAPILNNNIKKTIISFNINLLNGIPDIDLRLSQPVLKTKLNRLKDKFLGKEKKLKSIRLKYENEIKTS